MTKTKTPSRSASRKNGPEVTFPSDQEPRTEHAGPLVLIPKSTLIGLLIGLALGWGSAGWLALHLLSNKP